nr:integrase, catalytic region, zinc finger, CCHC-type, peptidase aspartic, catalytic [Tanacetum cinerariifolium]
MANLSKDIQSAVSDTRPHMLDSSDFMSWQQRICLYCMRKDNGENIIKSIDEGPFKMGKFRETLAEGGQANTFDDDVDKELVQDLSLNEDCIFQADQCDAFDSDVDEAPTTQTMFMENLSSANPIYNEAGLSYDSDIVSEVQVHDNYLDSVGEYQEVHEMQSDVQPNYVVDLDAEYMSDNNIILYDQFVKNNAEQVIQSNVSSVPNDALMMIINDMHEQAT